MIDNNGLSSVQSEQGMPFAYTVDVSQHQRPKQQSRKSPVVTAVPVVPRPATEQRKAVEGGTSLTVPGNQDLWLEGGGQSPADLRIVWPVGPLSNSLAAL